MYPFIRLGLGMLRQVGKPRLPIDTVFESHHIIMPWDIDIFGELNNGICLYVMDLARLPFGKRVGITKVLRQNKWALTMAGVSVRYRKRVKMFNRVRITTQTVGRDDRFFYIVQTMWVGQEPAHNALYRSVCYNNKGIVPSNEWAEAMGRPDWNPKLPKWVQEWVKAEDFRDWPPEV